MAETLEEWVQEIWVMAESMSEQIEPEEDWMPVLFLRTGEEKDLVVGLQMPMTPETKEVLGSEIMPQLIREHDATRFAFLSCAWTLEQETREGESNEVARERMIREMREYQDRLEDHPNRREILVIMAGDADGSSLCCKAEILRSEDEHPRLGEQEMLSVGPDEPGHLEGRLFSDAFDALGGGVTGSEVSEIVSYVAKTDHAHAMMEYLFKLAGYEPDVLENITDPDEARLVFESVMAKANELDEETKRDLLMGVFMAARNELEEGLSKDEKEFDKMLRRRPPRAPDN